jgi:hypothetical protein
VKQVAILGCGPAGLIAAWAVEQAGATPHIFSRKQKSHIPGSQYLHDKIPGITSEYPEGVVQYVRIGTAEGYSRKVYGDERETGWNNYLAIYPSWNVFNAYDRLWDRYEGSIVDAEITPLWVSGAVHDYDYDLVVSTLPQRAICDYPFEHQFNGVSFWIKTLPTPPADDKHDIVVYNGTDDPWYRWSVLGGVCSIEYSDLKGLPLDDGMIAGIKVTNNTCDCWPTVLRAGRWAEWKHGVLLHNVYPRVLEAVKVL